MHKILRAQSQLEDEKSNQRSGMKNDMRHPGTPKSLS